MQPALRKGLSRSVPIALPQAIPGSQRARALGTRLAPNAQVHRGSACALAPRGLTRPRQGDFTPRNRNRSPRCAPPTTSSTGQRQQSRNCVSSGRRDIAPPKLVAASVSRRTPWSAKRTGLICRHVRARSSGEEDKKAPQPSACDNAGRAALCRSCRAFKIASQAPLPPWTVWCPLQCLRPPNA